MQRPATTAKSTPVVFANRFSLSVSGDRSISRNVITQNDESGSDSGADALAEKGFAV